MRTISVLLVDDNRTFLDIATRFLQEHYSDELKVVGVAHGGKEALAQAEKLKPEVVLLDLFMPDLPGLQVIPQLRAMVPRTAIIVLTLTNGSGYRQAALAAGADGFVSKVSMNVDVLPAIREAVRSHERSQDA